MFGLSTTLIAVIGIVVLLVLLALLLFLNARQKRAKRQDTQGLQASDRALSRLAPSRPPARGSAVDATPSVAASAPTPTLSQPEAASSGAGALEAPEAPIAAVMVTPVGVRAAERLLEWDAESSEASPAPAPPLAPEVAPEAAPAPAPAPSAGILASTAAAPLADPVAYLIGSLLEGQGDLTEPELRRLELYRPGRVIVVAEELKGQMTGKGKEMRLARLARIQQYAETLRVRAEEKSAVPSAPIPTAATAPEPAPDVAPDTDLSLDQELSLLPSSAPAAAALTLVPPTPLVEAEPVATTEPPEEPEGAATIVGLTWDTPVEATTTQAEPAREPAPLSPVPETVPAVAASIPAQGFAFEEVDLVEDAVAEETVVEESVDEEELLAEPVQVSQETGAETLESTSTATELAAVTEEALAPPTLAAHTQTAEAPRSTEPAAGTAEHLLSLAVSERAAALPGLSAAEMSRILSQPADRELKLAAIDILEQQASPDALFAINESLEDPDPEVQLRALEAAERLLAKP